MPFGSQGTGRSTPPGAAGFLLPQTHSCDMATDMDPARATLPDSIAAPPRARLFATLIFVIEMTALIVQPMLGDGTIPENTAGMLRFFTIWSNIAACAIFALIASGRTVPRAAMAALATALAVVGLVYWLLLSGDHHPVGWDRGTNQVFHTFGPVAGVAWWLRYTPPAPRIAPLLPAIMVPPLAYGAFALALGLTTGFYAYFFLDLSQMGWGPFLLSNLVLAVFFAAMGAGLLAAKNALHRRLGRRSAG